MTYLEADGFFGFCFLNGSGGRELLGTDKMVFTALQNRLNASRPSFISAVRGFMGTILPRRGPSVRID
jgi:hypothetical protein